MIALIEVEFAKLSGTLALLLCAAAPLCAGVFTLLFVVKGPGGGDWLDYVGEAAATWAYFLLPLSITALTVLLAQVDHGPKMWRHLLALPVARASLYGAKFIVAAMLVAFMCALCWALVVGALWLGETLRPGVQIATAPDPIEAAQAFALMFAGSLMMIVVQLWAALRVLGFALPLVIGIVGTFASLAVATSQDGILAPWFIPAYVLRITEPANMIAVWVGALGGLVLAGLMAAHLSWREMTEI
jgi:ABC-2 type transport system permease protein